ncbi:molybdopterin-guanine dinucleotide biosynthesis protein B [Solidesulfovibrio sp.]|uniref:molybdopterin-guanine dinucleotide biosynthesis protein B n=1 Tax=Solidesulfovibrio sp. TaxID=2910990 RepID=UPI002608B920|nr:molybdopterin-guanine dinucleotide biosynthesis protein B [Solidesulfovibrio sp.]
MFRPWTIAREPARTADKSAPESRREAPPDVPVICIVAGRSKTGKTTLMEGLIDELTRRGHRVGAVKSDCHGFDMDVPGKDSWRFGRAGARATAVVGPGRYAVIQRTEAKSELDAVAALMRDVDIILAEGFKHSDKPKIEVVRQAMGDTLVSRAADRIALVTDVDWGAVSTPVFGLDDYPAIASFLVDAYLRPRD